MIEYVFVVRNSPVSFVLTGPGGVHRRIIARSEHDNLDLVGLDNSAVALDVRPVRFSASRAITYKQVQMSQSDMNYVMTDDVVSFESYGTARSSHLGFAWRGLASENDYKLIRDTLTLVAVDIAKAIDIDDQNNLEWQLSSLISLCSSANTTSSRRLLRMKYGIVGVLVIYAAVGILLLARVRLPF